MTSMRGLARCLLAVAAGMALAMFAVPAGSASAGEADSWGYLYLNDGAMPVGTPYTPDLSRQSSSSAVPGTVTRLGVGSYEVRFPGVNSPVARGVAHVTADTGNTECQLGPGQSFGVDVVLRVTCRAWITATPAQPSANICQTNGWSFQPGTAIASGMVICHTPQGARTNTDFSLTFAA